MVITSTVSLPHSGAVFQPVSQINLALSKPAIQANFTANFSAILHAVQKLPTQRLTSPIPSGQAGHTNTNITSGNQLIFITTMNSSSSSSNHSGQTANRGAARKKNKTKK
jgi:hypothetical protein